MSHSNRSLFVRDLPTGTRVEELRQLFTKYGPVTDVYIPRNFYTRELRSYAYVEFERPRYAERAKADGRNLKFMGDYLRVEFARGDRKSPHEMRRRDRSPRRGCLRRRSRSPPRRRSPFERYYGGGGGSGGGGKYRRSPGSSRSSSRERAPVKRSRSRSRSPIF